MCVFKYHAFIFYVRPPRWRRVTPVYVHLKAVFPQRIFGDRTTAGVGTATVCQLLLSSWYCTVHRIQVGKPLRGNLLCHVHLTRSKSRLFLFTVIFLSIYPSFDENKRWHLNTNLTIPCRHILLIYTPHLTQPRQWHDIYVHICSSMLFKLRLHVSL